MNSRRSLPRVQRAPRRLRHNVATAVDGAIVPLGASKAAVQHHYDLGNEFYGLWLDSSRTYSCAWWDGARNLEEAQRRKLDFHIDQANARSASRVLDVGCGWGSLLYRLVDAAGVREAVGLTLSDAQAAWISERRHPCVKAMVQNWRDHQPPQPYDAIISIGAFEHFAQPDLSAAQIVAAYREFFAKCHALLTPGGRLSLQTIAYGTARRKNLNRFIIEHIFPESDLPMLADIALACDGIFEVALLRNDRADYETTLKHWYFNLRANKRRAIDLVGPEAVANYEKYLSLFMVGFHTGAMNLLRIAMRRIDRLDRQ